MIVNGEKRRSYKQLPDDQLEYFKSIVEGRFTKEISDLFYDKFNIRLKKTDIENIKRTYGLYSKIKNWNKGMKNPYDPSREIGEERILHSNKKEKCLEIKTKDGWVRKSHYIWEKYNGKIPENHFIGFKDGNILNCDIDNLVLMSYTDRIIFNFNKLNMHKGEELLKTNILISELMQKRNKIKKR